LFGFDRDYKKLKRYHAVKYLLVPAPLVRLAVALTILLCSSSVFAQGTVQERAACGNDFKKFCRHTQGGMAAASCLQAHRKSLAPIVPERFESARHVIVLQPAKAVPAASDSEDFLHLAWSTKI